jgi:hypothetical protein
MLCASAPQTARGFPPAPLTEDDIKNPDHPVINYLNIVQRCFEGNGVGAEVVFVKNPEQSVQMGGVFWNGVLRVKPTNPDNLEKVLFGLHLLLHCEENSPEFGADYKELLLHSIDRAFAKLEQMLRPPEQSVKKRRRRHRHR